jgi:predicted transcriptional regulator
MERDYTVTLSDATIERIESTAETLGRSNGEVIEDAMAKYHEPPDRLTDAERQRMLKVLERIRNRPSPKTEEDVRREIEEIRAARRSGGRRTPVE